MACFRCNKYGHWARDCAVSRVCEFCGVGGHVAADCDLQLVYKKDCDRSTTIEVQVTKTRTRKADVDMFVRANFMRSGIIDDVALSQYIAESIMISARDRGHMSVVGYMIAKYVGSSNDYMRTFLRRVGAEIGDDKMFRALLREKFGVSVYEKAGKIHFRRLVGWGC